MSHDNSGASQMPTRLRAILVQTSNAFVPGGACDCKWLRVASVQSEQLHVQDTNCVCSLVECINQHHSAFSFIWNSVYRTLNAISSTVVDATGAPTGHFISKLLFTILTLNPLPVQFKTILHGQKGCVFFSGHLNLRTAPETGLPSREKNHN